ncbi:unnamed protein product [Dicrocoelium dendriticum]|nr:unnamed protein product [Dicrocoelium dendriticum]
MDRWSSDGDSASSSSSASPVEFSHSFEATLPRDSAILCFSPTGDNLLKQARIFTNEELIDQAIYRWQSYIGSCSEAFDVLRQQLVAAYIPYALEQHRRSQSTSRALVYSIVENIFDIKAKSGQGRRALRNMLRHSVRTANQRHLTCVSKFAIVSNNLAKWRKSCSDQRCRFRDPTTTTWEKPCGNLCLPLLPVCAYHLVQLNPAPTLHGECLQNDAHNYSCSTTVERMSNVEPASSLSPESVKTGTTSTGGDSAKSATDRSQPLTRSTRSVKTGHVEAVTTNSCTSGASTTLQLPIQFLLRRCGGTCGQSCDEPVVAWSSATRCRRHLFSGLVSCTTPWCSGCRHTNNTSVCNDVSTARTRPNLSESIRLSLQPAMKPKLEGR